MYTHVGFLSNRADKFIIIFFAKWKQNFDE